MPMNRIQFQPGLSLPAFLEQFGTEAAVRSSVGTRPLAGRVSLSSCGQATHYIS